MDHCIDNLDLFTVSEAEQFLHFSSH